MAVLPNISTRAPKDFDKSETKEQTLKLVNKMDDLQELLYASSKYSLLVVIQGMDASGKDGAIRHVFSGVNPQGVSVVSFKAPTPEELSHDFLWRIHKNTPAKGVITIFNRSHYEDVLITRVHGWCDDDMARKRFKAINQFEKMLYQQNETTILKFYLHVSPEEQKERLDERLSDPKKAWKYNPKDFDEARLWDKYMAMYEDVFENCNEIPWTIVPADQNWYKEYLITKTIVDTLEGFKMEYPPMKESK